MARIYRDAYGVPHVRAASVTDLAWAQGEVTARDRTWQLEWQRRRATGTTAAVFGSPALAWDVLARRVRIADGARRDFERLDGETQRFLTAYAEGVNAGLASVDPAGVPELAAFGLAPSAWEPWTPVAVFSVQHLLFANLQGKLWSHRSRGVLGDEARLLVAEGESGSNAWAVGGDRTASGLPMIGGDPHRTFESPGVYQQVRLACEDPDDAFDVVGFTFPGVPGVQHFAHAGPVAWAITNAMASYQDVYAETLRRAGLIVEALGPDGWEPAEVRHETVAVAGSDDVLVEVVTTARGPVFEGSPGDERCLSLRAAPDVLGHCGFEALLPLLRARSADDVDQALESWVQPVNNVVIADEAGTVRYRVAGAVPVRHELNRLEIVPATDPAYVWQGWVDDLPRHEVPADGQVVTANERRGPESHRIGAHFAPPHRAARIAALLEGRSGLTVDDFASIHGDTLLPILDLVREVLAGCTPGPDGDAVRREVLAWDGRMDAGSSGAAAYAAWRSALTTLVSEAAVLRPLGAPHTHSPVFGPAMDLTAHVGLAVETWLGAPAPFGLDLVDLAGHALDVAAGHAPTWGSVHTLLPTHGLDLVGAGDRRPDVPDQPVSGDDNCVRCTGSLPGLTDQAYRGSVARYVWDLSDRQAGGWVVPLGASGRPGDPHHLDQLAPWADAVLVPIVTDWDRLVEET